MESRIKRIFSNLDGKADAIILANSEYPNIDLNFFYVTGIMADKKGAEWD
ncbi:MAG: hypothetical protein HYT70_01935 [Candidatus Aenigmarchaeota archaeon]|nr:hypothetical protein [Candidatus Aenigmarchaeota archaeon]